ncbi:hypothetical protein [Nonomuraea africana]|uniref:DUF2867 domain-containing protein n=1 Tax=Nonomuraea africana TaxID=46171 RepID=A0ABR9K5V5_9ACTN|nr:hypothetical protein [Nonomuraea africana]MBE1557389.1 hypothetical protein [Nonomuraea africana]
MKANPGTGSVKNESVLPVFQQHDVPEAIRGLSAIADSDYVDVFTLVTSDASARTPEQWARAAFEDAAALQGQFVWRVLLGLRLQRRPSRVAGWKIADRGGDWIRLEARSWMLTGHLVILVEDEQVSLATAVRYDRPTAARVWTPLSAIHRRLAPSLLRDAYKAVRQAGPR